jgi:hypothetical protein
MKKAQQEILDEFIKETEECLIKKLIKEANFRTLKEIKDASSCLSPEKRELIYQMIFDKYLEEGLENCLDKDLLSILIFLPEEKLIIAKENLQKLQYPLTDSEYFLKKS